MLESNCTLGLNAFPLYYKTNYWLWIDNPKFSNCVYQLNHNRYSPFFQFEPNIDLMGVYTVASFALSFAVKMGYEKAVLFGVLDGDYRKVGGFYNHAGEMKMTYRHFYDQEDKTIYMMKLQQFKSIINSYNDKIEVEIPFGSI